MFKILRNCNIAPIRFACFPGIRFFCTQTTHYTSMKKALLLGLSVAAALATQAQPVIESANLVPVGFSASLNAAAPVNPGPAGANQTWDFSATPNSPVGTYSRINPADATGNGTYPTANCVWSIFIGSAAKYEFYNNSPGNMVQLGEWSSTSTGDNYSANPKMLFSFPFSFGNAVNDPWATTGGSSGTVVRTYDGYGTLITPFGTYQNVVRVTTTGSASNTVWYNSNPVFPLMQTEAGNTVFMSNIVNATPENQAEMAVSVFPNPATDVLFIQAPEEVTKVTAINALGQQMQLPVTGSKVAVHTLTAGVYQLVLSTASGKTGLQRFVKL